MPRTPEQNEAIREKRRRKLFKASVERFAALGYDDLTIDNITRISGCSHGLFYHYYKDKTVIFEAIVRDVLGEGAPLPPVDEAKNAGGLNGLKVFCDYLDFLLGAPLETVYVGKIGMDLRLSEDVDQSLPPVILSKKIEPALIELVKQGQGNGDVVDGDPQEIVDAFLCLFDDSLTKKMGKCKEVPVSGKTLYAFLVKNA